MSYTGLVFFIFLIVFGSLETKAAAIFWCSLFIVVIYISILISGRQHFCPIAKPTNGMEVIGNTMMLGSQQITCALTAPFNDEVKE